jgi:hypothetical protein
MRKSCKGKSHESIPLRKFKVLDAPSVTTAIIGVSSVGERRSRLSWRKWTGEILILWWMIKVPYYHAPIFDQIAVAWRRSRFIAIEVFWFQNGRVRSRIQRTYKVAKDRKNSSDFDLIDLQLQILVIPKWMKRLEQTSDADGVSFRNS